MRTLATLVYLMAMATAPGATCSDFEVRFVAWPPEVPRGVQMEVVAEARNRSGREVTVAHGEGGFELAVHVRRADGQRRVGCLPTEIVYWAPGYSAEVLPASWHMVRAFDITCEDPVGELLVSATLSSQSSSGRYPKGRRGASGEFSAWTGRVESAEVSIRVTDPVGIDREVYDALAGDPMADPRRLRAEFPTSTYAAYHVWKMTGAQGLARSEPAAVIAQTSRGMWGVTRWIACPPSVCPGEPRVVEVSAERAIEWSRYWIEIVLKAHPDIWFADDLRLRLALDEIIAGKIALGAAALESLAKTGRPDMSAKAGELLALARQQHLVE